jgi:activating signal cointegrator complex subunit 3
MQEREHRMDFTVPIFEPIASHYYARLVSLDWLHAESFAELDLHDIVLPAVAPPHTDLLPLEPLPLKVLQQPRFEALYKGRFTHFNPIQTQAFHTLYHTDENVLLGAPTGSALLLCLQSSALQQCSGVLHDTVGAQWAIAECPDLRAGSGKTISSELTMLRVFLHYPDEKILYIAPLKALVRERLIDWGKGFSKRLNKRMVELTGDYTPDLAALLAADIIICTGKHEAMCSVSGW